MFKKVAVAIMVLGFLFCGTAYAEKFVTLPDGNKVDVSKLSSQEISDLVKISVKATPEIKETIMDTIMGVDPNELDQWRQLFTGTIRDICNDLNVTVNEFVKTPVGMGVSALIIYRVAGQDILTEVMDIILCIPFWIIFTGINAFLLFYFYGTKLVYDTVMVDGKATKTNARKIHRYPWKETNDGKSDAREAIGWYIVVSEVLITLVCFCMVVF